MYKINNVKTRAELANLIGISLKRLTTVLYSKDINLRYNQFEIEKKYGRGVRTISYPDDELMYVLRKLNNVLSDFYEENFLYKKCNQASQGFVRGKSIITNAEKHRNKKYVLNVDLENFFDHFHFGRVRGFFQKDNRLKLPQNIATIIAQLVCYDGKLPQGAPTSPTIANMISNILDSKIIRLCTKYKLTYTRYADDLTFSTNDQTFPEKKVDFLNELENLIEKNGHAVNHDKVYIQRYENRQVVTGLTVNKKVNVPNRYSNQTRALAHNLYTNSEYTLNGEKYNINENYDITLSILTGRYNFSNMLDEYNREKGYNNQISSYRDFTKRERDYLKFLFYKNFWANQTPVVITEGKTDFIYIKSAREALCDKGISSVDDFDYQLLKKTDSIIKYMFLRQPDKNRSEGASDLEKIFYLYTSKIRTGNMLVSDEEIFKYKDKSPHYYHFFKNECIYVDPKPVVMLLDNEENKNKPLKKILNSIFINGAHTNYNYLQKENFLNLVGNLYLAVVPRLESDPKDFEIEDLFFEDDLDRFEKVHSKKAKEHKNEFAKHVESNIERIDFKNFIRLFSLFEKIKEYHMEKNICN